MHFKGVKRHYYGVKGQFLWLFLLRAWHYIMVLVVRKPDFVACEKPLQQRCRPDCASAHSDQHLWKLESITCHVIYRIKYCLNQSIWSSQTFSMLNFNVLASLCSWACRFEPYLVTNPDERFSHIEAQYELSASRWYHMFFCVFKVSNTSSPKQKLKLCVANILGKAFGINLYFWDIFHFQWELVENLSDKFTFFPYEYFYWKFWQKNLIKNITPKFHFYYLSINLLFNS